MKQAVNSVAAVLQGLQKELGRLVEASKEGQLSERGKPDQFQGAYAGIVKRRQRDAGRHPGADRRGQPNPRANPWRQHTGESRDRFARAITRR